MPDEGMSAAATPSTPCLLPPRGTLLAFDYGLARIGVATGEIETGTASPLATIEIESTAKRFDAIARLIKEWQPVACVVGLPIPPDGEGEHPLAPLCRRFARQLNGRFHLPAHLVDERFSSVEAERSLRDAGMKDWQARKQKLDAAAAQLILQQFLDAHRRVAG